MTSQTPNSNDVAQQFAEIKDHLKDIRHDVSAILRSLQDELDAFREREFWRDYGDSYHKE